MSRRDSLDHGAREMNEKRSLSQGWVTSLLAAALAITFGCGGGGGGGGGVTGAFTGSGSAAASDLVRLRATTIDEDVVGVEVAIGGATTSTDLYAFAFDLVLSDATVVRYLTGSATLGSALTLSGGQTSSVQVTQTGSRLIVGVTKMGGGAGNGVPAGESAVLGFRLQVLKTGVTTLSFAGSSSPQNPTSDPAALDHDLSVVTSVRFDTAAATVTGR